jgi:hypothetical protein
MSKKNDLLDDAVELIRAAGYEPSVTRGRHYKVTWQDQQGRVQRLVVSFSPSDRRARHWSKSILKKLLTAPDRTSGIQKEITT